MKRPAFQFYPGDWMRSTDLRSCSVGARGLWIDMICLMHEGTPYGHLKVNQKVILPVNLARIVGATLPETEGWLNELEHAGVFSKDGDVIVCRRMVRDEEIRSKRMEGGKLGGNPVLMLRENKVNLPTNLPPTMPITLEITPASASSSASSNGEKEDAAVRFAKIWNELPKPFPQVVHMGEGRKRALKARLKDQFWKDNFRAALTKLPSLPFATGQNERGWVADIDFFLRPDSVEKIIEGKYENKTKPPTNGSKPSTIEAPLWSEFISGHPNEAARKYPSPETAPPFLKDEFWQWKIKRSKAA